MQRPVERGLLGDSDPVDPVEVGDQFRIRRAHRVTDGGHQLADDRAVDVEQLGRADHPPKQPAQHVAAAVVARADAVADQDGRGAAVVGDDPVAHVVGVVADVIAAGRTPGHRVDGRSQQVGFVDVGHALQQERDPLDAHAGVDVLARQRTQDFEVVFAGALAAFVLHEHEIPDLDVAVLVGFRATVDAELGTAVVVDLRRRAARPGNAHRPIVIGHAAALDSLDRQVRDLPPQLHGFVVVEIYCGPELFRIKTISTVVDFAGQQRPSQLDGLALEIVAEREIAGHLEKGVVPGGDPDFVDIGRANAFLNTGGRRIRRGALAEEERHELHHAGVDEQQVGVVENHRGTRYLGMARVHEMIEEPLPDLVCLHFSASS